MLSTSKGFLCILFLLFSLTTTTQVTGLTYWEDDFSDDADWEFTSFTIPTYSEISTGFEIIDGKLVAPYTGTTYTEVHNAYHVNTVTTGNWSFEWNVPANSNTYDCFSFIHVDHSPESNLTGLTDADLNRTGYGVGFDIEDTNAEIWLYKWFYPVVTDNVDVMDETYIAGSQTGSHQIDIARNGSGLIQVFYDKTLILEKTDTDYSRSEDFVWHSYLGNSSIDNLVVTDQLEMYEAPDPTDDDDGAIHSWLVLPGILLMVIYRRKKR